MLFTFETRAERHDDAKSTYWLVTVPQDTADDIEDIPVPRGGWGSIKVEAIIGRTTWRTSLFPSKRAGSFILLLNKAVRSAENINQPGQLVSVSVYVLGTPASANFT